VDGVPVTVQDGQLLDIQADGGGLGSGSISASSLAMGVANAHSNLSKLALLGASWVLYLLLALSVFSIGIIGRALVVFPLALRRHGQPGGWSPAQAQARDRRGADELLPAEQFDRGGRLLPALEWLDGGPDRSRRRSRRRSARSARDGKGLIFLGTLGNNAPFIGLLGTVIA